MQRVFCDLDSVLADFDRRVFEPIGCKPSEVEPVIMWNAIRRDQNFFVNLKWTHDGEQLWKYIKRFNPTILTGIPRGEFAIKQKQQWCRDHLGKHIEVMCCRSKEKQKFITQPGDILIDDREDNCQRWIDAGGDAIIHTSAIKTINQLKTIIALGH